MDLDGFIDMAGRLDAQHLRRVAAVLLRDHDTAGATVDWWHAVLAIDRAHRAGRSRRVGAVAAHRACAALLAGAHREGLAADDADVVAAARAAGTVAWALAAGPLASHDALRVLLRPWLAALELEAA